MARNIPPLKDGCSLQILTKKESPYWLRLTFSRAQRFFNFSVTECTFFRLFKLLENPLWALPPFCRVTFFLRHVLRLFVQKWTSHVEIFKQPILWTYLLIESSSNNNIFGLTRFVFESNGLPDGRAFSTPSLSSSRSSIHRPEYTAQCSISKVKKSKYRKVEIISKNLHQKVCTAIDPALNHFLL